MDVFDGMVVLMVLYGCKARALDKKDWNRMGLWGRGEGTLKSIFQACHRRQLSDA